MSERINARHVPASPTVEAFHQAHPITAPRAAAGSSPRAAGIPARAVDQFDTRAPRDRRIDRALAAPPAAQRPPTPAENRLSHRIASNEFLASNLATLITRMERTPSGPSYAGHLADVPRPPSLDEAIREQQAEVLAHQNHVIAHQAAEHGLEGLAELTEHTGSAAAPALGILSELAPVVGAVWAVGESAARSLSAGDERYRAAVREQVWENHQGAVAGHIAQSRADGRDAVRAGNTASTAEPLTIDWSRFGSDGDYAEGALRELRQEYGATQMQLAHDRETLTRAQRMSPQEQSMFPWQLDDSLH